MSALKRLAALSCVGLIAATTACGSSKSTGPVAGAPNVTIKVGSANAFTSLDPANAYDTGSWNLYYNVYQGLMHYKPGANVPSPDAAKSCDYTDGTSMTYKCTLRSGMKFSNGDPLDSSAVKYSFERVLKIHDPGSAWQILNTIKSIDTPDPTTVIFHLTSPDATMPDRFSSGVASIIDPKSFSADKENDPFAIGVGSGRYKIDSVSITGSGADRAATEVKLSLNPNYQGDDTAPQNSAVDVKYFADQASDKKALDDKTVDVVIQDLNATDVVTMQNNQQLGTGLQVTQGPGGSVRLMSFNTKAAPFNNVAVRQAVASLIDREAIADTAFQHTVTPAYTILPSSITNATAAFAQVYTRSPKPAAKVKRLLQNANVQLPVSFTLSYGQGDKAKQVEVQMIKQQLEASGLFKVTLQPFPGYGKMAKAILIPGKFQAFMVAWQADYLDGDDYITPIVGGKDNALFNSYGNNLLPLIKQGLTYSNRPDAKSTYDQIQKIVAQDAPVIPTWENSQYAAAQANITGVPLTMDAAGIPRWWMIGKN